MRVDLDLEAAGAAAQRRVVGLLRSVLADREAGQFEQRVGFRLLLRRRADVAQHVRQRRAVRIVAGSPHLYRHARQFGRVDLDGRHLAPRQVFAHQHRGEGAPARRLAQDARAGLVVDGNPPGDRVQRPLQVARLLRRQDETVVAAVARQFDAGAVEDGAARRRQQAQVDAVLLSLGAVAVAVEDLELVEAPAERRHEAQLAGGEDRRAAREGPPPPLLLPVHRAQFIAPRSSRPAHRTRAGSGAGRPRCKAKNGPARSG